jgi:Cu/Ag efflux protein CusF
MTSITRIKALAAACLVGLSAAAAAQDALTNGEVRKVDKELKKITLKHEPIRNLDMPAMTMVFNVPDPKLLDKVQPGDRVRFAATNEGGKLTITQIEPAK